MRKILFIIALPLVLISCKQSKEEMLTQKWQGISVDNKQQDKFFAEQAMFLDTFGKNNDAATNKKIYGFTDVDSARISLKAELEDYKAMQQHAIENTWFDFRKGGIAIMNFSGQTDSVNWQINKEGKLILDETKIKGDSAGAKITMEILQLTDTALQLKFTDNGGTSTVTFHPFKKK